MVVALTMGFGAARTPEPTVVAPAVTTPAAVEDVMSAAMPAVVWQAGAEDPQVAWPFAAASLTGRVPRVLQKVRARRKISRRLAAEASPTAALKILEIPQYVGEFSPRRRGASTPIRSTCFAAVP